MHSTEGSAVYNFQYANPTRVCFGEGQIATLPELIPAGSRLLVLYGGGSARSTGTLAEAYFIGRFYLITNISFFQ